MMPDEDIMVGSNWYETLKTFQYLGAQIKLLIENKLIICALENLHYKISREKFEPEPGFVHYKTSGGPRFESRFWFKFFSSDLIM